MKRLVTQFDDRRTRATLATPTCCCCCCCCCVASVVTATTVTALNAHELAGQSERRSDSAVLYVIAAVLALPLAVLAAVFAGRLADAGGASAPGWYGLAVLLLIWPALLCALYASLGLPSKGKVTAITVVAFAAMFCVEFVCGLVLIVGAEFAGLVLYLLLASVMAYGGTRLLRRWTAD